MLASREPAEELFLNALEITDRQAQQNFLDQACSADPRLRQQVAALLQAHERADSFLDEPLVSPVPGGFVPNKALKRSHFAADPEPPRDDQESRQADEGEIYSFLAASDFPGSLGRLGNYEVLEHLGSGGFGMVFKAFDETLRRVVALKIMAPAIAVTSPARKRFLREARSSAAVCHENVVRIHAVEERPLPYLIMEFVPGETLQERIDRAGPFDVAEVLSIGRQVAQGLAAAHETSLIHRDIKPGNILIENGATPRVKITDFGLARAADDASLTQSGVVAGTPMYMAPEQANGETLDHRADLFSLGSVLYVISTGRPPFRASSPMAVLKRVCEDQPRPIREVIAEIPLALVQIIERLHEKDPEKRIQTAREVAQTLTEFEAELLQTGTLRESPQLSLPTLSKSISQVRPRRQLWGQWMAAAACAVCLCTLAVVFAVQQASGWSSPQAQTGEPADTSTPESWEKIDPLNDCKIRWENGGPTMTVPGDGRHIYDPLGPTSDQNGPRVLREVTGDFEAVTTIVAPASQFPVGSPDSRGAQAAGLMIWADEGDRIARFMMTGQHSGKVEWYFGGKRQGEKSVDVAADPVHLRVQKKEGILNFEWSSDKRTWTWVHTVPDFTFGSPVKVGATATNSSKQPFTARFPDLTIDSHGDRQEKELPQKWLSLFNGKDLSGWEPQAGHPKYIPKENGTGPIEWLTLPGKKLGEWRVEKGILIGKGKLAGLLYTVPFENFHFRALMQVNSIGTGGIYLRRKDDHPDDLPDSKDCGAVVRGMDTASFQEFGPNTHSTGSRTWLRVRGDTWTLIDLIANGPRILINHAGMPTGMAQDSPRDFKEGQIALQIWDADTEIRFREIEIMELPKLTKDHRLARSDAMNMSQYYGSLIDVIMAKQKILDADKARFQQGRISAQKLIKTECDLVESRMQCAIAQYRHDEFAQALTELVELRERELALVSKSVEAGREPRKSADQVAFLVSQAKDRLVKAGGLKKRELPPGGNSKKD